MQNPPGPPQSSPPAATSGIDKRTGAVLAYLAWWVTGLIFLFVGKNDPDVKYHGAQSVVVFGALTVLQVALGIIGNFVGFIGLLGTLVWIVEIVLWFVCLFKAWTGGGQRFEVPLIGGVTRPYVEQLMNAVN
jgi:uncharacterized membrane protein